MSLIKPENLDLNIGSSSLEKLKYLEIRLEILKTFSDSFELSEQGLFPIGSRVKLEGGLLGRVWHKSKSTREYYINRDGFAQTIKIPGSKMENLSSDQQGILEREVWLTETRIQETKRILENSAFPCVLKENTRIAVQVVEIIKDYPCEIITFIEAVNLESHQIKLPSGLILSTGYFEIIMVDNKLSKILVSSEKAFDLLHQEAKNNVD